MGRMLNARDVNMDQALKELGAMTPDEVKTVDWQHIASEYGGVPALPAPEHPVQIAPPGPRDYTFATSDPFAVALIRRLKYSNANIAFLEVKYGDNLEALLGALRSAAASGGIDILDITRQHRPEEAILDAIVVEEELGTTPGGGDDPAPDTQESPESTNAIMRGPVVPGLTPVDTLQADDLVKD